MSPPMSTNNTPAEADFTARERDYIRRGLAMFFSTYPTVAAGLELTTWRTGARAGQPKLPPAAAPLVERGLMRLDATGRLPRLFFTEAGMQTLRCMVTDRRFTDARKFAHIRRELGIDPETPDVADERQ
jgi:hypothetical protein